MFISKNYGQVGRSALIEIDRLFQFISRSQSSQGIAKYLQRGTYKPFLTARPYNYTSRAAVRAVARSRTRRKMSDSQSGNTFTLLTFNINDDATSESAPQDWTLKKQHDLLRTLILTHNPDLLCLQECFEFPSRLVEEYEFHGAVPSHRGECYIATRKDSPLQADGPATAAGPCVLLPLRLADLRFTAASAHLAPFGEFAPVRARQVAAIVQAAQRQLPLVLAGDMNMRGAETGVTVENGLRDAWLDVGSPADVRWTWDTRTNRYYVAGHRYTARYDRVLFRGCRVLKLARTGDRACTEVPEHFLSDHFGLVLKMELVEDAAGGVVGGSVAEGL